LRAGDALRLFPRSRLAQVRLERLLDVREPLIDLLRFRGCLRGIDHTFARQLFGVALARRGVCLIRSYITGWV